MTQKWQHFQLLNIFEQILLQKFNFTLEGKIENKKKIFEKITKKSQHFKFRKINSGERL